MAIEQWKAEKSIQETVFELIKNNHPDLVPIMDEIVVLFKEKAGKSGGQTVFGTVSKAPPSLKAISGQNYQFLILLAADTWETELGAKQREALLDHLLCMCRCEEDPKTAEPKCSIARPDLYAFRDNVDRYGMWFPKEEPPVTEGPETELLDDE